MTPIRRPSKSSRSRLIETHTNSLKHLLAKDGVIYKEAMAIVVEDIKKIIQEEMADTAFLSSYLTHVEVIQKEQESHEESPPAKRPKFGTREMPINPLCEFIDLCVVEACP